MQLEWDAPFSLLPRGTMYSEIPMSRPTFTAMSFPKACSMGLVDHADLDSQDNDSNGVDALPEEAPLDARGLTLAAEEMETRLAEASLST